jgi:hypothetical protein
MLDKHEPDPQFVENLEWQLGGEARRRGRGADGRPFWARVARASLLVVVSVALGAAAMGASYQIEESWRRDLLVAGLEVRLEMARLRIDVTAEEMARVQQRVAEGVRSEEDLAAARMFLLETEAAARLIELELEEIRVSGREPLGEISSPLVGGRDFVSEHIGVEMRLERERLNMVADGLERERRRYDAGVIDEQQLQSMRFGLLEYEERLESLEDRLSIRRDFLAGSVSAVQAELLVLVRDAERKEERARRELELARGEMLRARSRVEAGRASPFAARQVELMFAELEGEARLARIELDVLERELRERGGRR